MHQPQLGKPDGQKCINPVPPRIGNGVRVLQELHPPRNWYRNCDMYIYIYLFIYLFIYLYSIYIYYIYISVYIYIYSIHIIPPLTNSSIWADGMMESSIPILLLATVVWLITGSLDAHLICSKVLKRSAKAKGINPRGTLEETTTGTMGWGSSAGDGNIPSGKHTKSYWKWPFIVDLPIENGDFI